MKNLFLIIILILIFSSLQTYSLEITNLRPIGGEIYQNSNTYTLLWEIDDTTSSINLMLWDGSLTQWFTIANSIPGNTTSYDWVVDQTPGTLYRLKAVDANDSNSYTMSIAYITIIDPPQQYVSVNDEYKQIRLNLFPNPSSDLVQIEVKEEPIKELFLWDSNGELINRVNKINSNHYNLNVNHNKNGLYFIEVVLESGYRLTTKMILVK